MYDSSGFTSPREILETLLPFRTRYKVLINYCGVNSCCRQPVSLYTSSS